MAGLQAPLENPLWEFSLVIYAEHGVQEECLALQEQFGLDVNLLLFCAYAGGIEGVRLSAEDLDAAEGAIGGWHRGVVRPLRAARRALKIWSAEGPQALRSRVKADELKAEQIEQAMLWAWSRQHLAGRAAGARDKALAANLTQILSFHDAPDAAAPNLARAVLRRAAKS